MPRAKKRSRAMKWRWRRQQHEQHLSRVFDEVMGLGDFADSSRGSASSSRSGGQDETKGEDKSSGQAGPQEVEEGSNGVRPEEKTDEGMGEPSLPHLSSPSPAKFSPLTVGTKQGEEEAGAGPKGGGGAAASDDALDGLEEDEDWHFALPSSLQEDEANKKNTQSGEENITSQGFPSAEQPKKTEEDLDKDGSNSSTSTCHSSQDNTPENSQDGSVLKQSKMTEESQQGERSKATPPENSDPKSPVVNIKDEPIDEGYDAALLPQPSIKQIKEELDSQEEELRISSVFSVGGGNSFATPAVPAAMTAPHHPPTTILMPGRGAILQAMASLPVRPQFQVPGSQPAVAAMPPRPPQPGSVRCSGCSKVLLKGQTAFQRKGSTQLFCSTVCLTGHLPPANKGKSCIQCNREILQLRDMITIPADNNSFLYFCGQFCLSVYRHKKKQPDKRVDKRPEKMPEKLPEKPAEQLSDKPSCSVCKVSSRGIEHEVTHQGRLHKLCSNACFITWRKMRQLAMNCCEGCGLYCSSSSSSCQTLTIEKTQLNFCSPTCISTFKPTCNKPVGCAYCHKMAIVASTIMERDQKGRVQLYCSSACVESSRPPQHFLTGAAFPCSLCKVSAVPQYHLAMVDRTIRNFCSYDCVSAFRQKTGQPSAPQTTGSIVSLKDPPGRDKLWWPPRASVVPPLAQDYPSSVPYQSHHPSHTSVPPLVPPSPTSSNSSAPVRVPAAGQSSKTSEGGPSKTPRLTCQQCSRQFSIKPLLLSHQGSISMFCSKTCCEQYKSQKNITVLCEGCKQEKVLYSTINYNLQDVFFCSEGCEQSFIDGLKSGKDHPLRPCSYCSGISQEMLHSHYGGSLEEFCRPHCMSQFTILYYRMGRCDCCRKQGSMSETLQCLGAVRNFCNLSCLLQYCSLHFESPHTGSNGAGAAPQTPYAPAQPHHPSKMNPVIADVVSLSNGSANQPGVSAHTTLTGALASSNLDGKNLDHASTQTDAMRLPTSRRRQMKNKWVLCRPFTMDQATTCQLPDPPSGSAAVSISAPAPVDSPPQPRLCVDAATSPAPSPPPPPPPPSPPPPPPPPPQEEKPPCNGLPTRLTGRHFLGQREAESDCKVCSQHKRRRPEDEDEEKRRKKQKMEGEEPEREGDEEEAKSRDGEHCEPRDGEQRSGQHRSQTSFYCKTCSGEPSLCPVPCFELFHTRLIYKTVLQLETQDRSSAVDVRVKVLLVPVPVPVFIPVPMNMYSQHTPVPMAVPLPVPVPVVVPAQSKEMKDAAVQSEAVAVEEHPQNSSEPSSSYSRDMRSHLVSPTIPEEKKLDPQLDAQPQEESVAASGSPWPITHNLPPSSPIMDLETDFPAEPLDQKPPVPKRRGVKRARESFSGRKRGRRRTAASDSRVVVVVPPPAPKVNHVYGVKAWRSWVQQRNKQLRESSLVDVKEDVLQCDSAELSFALTRFIREVRRPNGEIYSPDSIFYLCLGIQQYLFLKGRIENIFTDVLYNQFAAEISRMLQLWKPKLLPSGAVVPSRVVESYLWECKQLGAYSPIVLLNTLLFFCTKNFHFSSLEQHQRLSFTNFTRCSRSCSQAGRVHFLRHQRGSADPACREGTEGRLGRGQTEQLGDLEMLENVTNPLQCPVRLYEFYLSRCPESVKKRSDVFYLLPQQNVHTHSPHWFTTRPLEGTTLQSMLTRILAVREVHQEQEAAWCQPSVVDDALQ